MLADLNYATGLWVDPYTGLDTSNVDFYDSYGEYPTWSGNYINGPSLGSAYAVSPTVPAGAVAPAPASGGGGIVDWIMGMFGQTPSGTSTSSQIPATLVQLYKAGQQQQVASQLLQLNIQRAQMVPPLPPLTLDQIGAASLLTPTAQVGLTTNTLLVIGGGIALLALAVGKK